MSKLLARLSDAAKSGVYAAPHLEDILDATRGSGLQVARIDLGGAAGKDALLDRISAALRFPDWFGRNWDALEDCLADLSWSKARGHVLLFESASDLSLPDRKTLTGILEAAAADWRGRNRSFFAVFIGDATGLPELYRPRK
jgi:hypothetical protein